jgi:hypothetical protein
MCMYNELQLELAPSNQPPGFTNPGAFIIIFTSLLSKEMCPSQSLPLTPIGNL